MPHPQSSKTHNADPVEELIALHHGDTKAALRTLLSDYGCLQEQLALAVVAMGHGYTRGWRPGIEQLDAVHD